jgi:rhodanese-related sulfurtransferase
MELFSILSYKKILGMIISSSLLGLVINHFNPDGIPLIREKLELKWAPDSLFMDLNQDIQNSTDDSSSIIIPEKDKAKNISEKQSKENNPEEIKSDQKEPQKIAEEIEKVQAFTEPKAITLEQAYKLFNNGVQFVDARDESDYLAGHITNSINIPFDDFDNHKQKLEQLSKEKPLVIYCAGTDCDLSILLGNLLFEKGYKQVYVFFGGWNEWLNVKYPTEQSSE